MILETLTSIATLAVLIVHSLRIRQVERNAAEAAAELAGKIDHVADETNIEASITRRYLGKLCGDPGLTDGIVSQTEIDSGTF
jgi:hypothetical protein